MVKRRRLDTCRYPIEVVDLLARAISNRPDYKEYAVSTAEHKEDETASVTITRRSDGSTVNILTVSMKSCSDWFSCRDSVGMTYSLPWSIDGVFHLIFKDEEATRLMAEYGMPVRQNGESKTLPITKAEQMNAVILRNDMLNEKIRAYHQTVRPMDPDWKSRVREDFWWGRESREPNVDPLLYELRDKILTFGGEAVCMSFGEPDAAEILKYGQLWTGYGAKSVRGKMCRCHENSYDMARSSNGQKRLCTGYALSDDGMWVQHSWCIEKHPRKIQVFETTEKRVMYFGYVLPEYDFHRFGKRL